MTRVRKTPERTCIGCRRAADKRELVRVVRTPEGHIEIDSSGKANGRGAYVCSSVDCFDAAVTRKRIDPALRVKLKTDDVDRLRRDFESMLAQTTLSPQGR